MSLTWTDNVTPLNAVNMSKLIQEDEVVAATARIVANKLLAGDAQPAFRILGDGKHEWGPGGSGALDASLYRSSTGELRSSSDMGSLSYLIAALGTAAETWIGSVGGSSGIYFGSASDVNLYRWGVDLLKTDDSFVAAGHLYADGGALVKQGVVAYNTDAFWQTTVGYWAGASGPGIAFSLANDTSLYREQAQTLRTDGSLVVNGADVNGYGLKLYGGNIAFLRPTGGSTILTTVVSGDTSYRLTVDINGTINWGPGNAAADVNLYRSAAGYLRTGGNFQSDTFLWANEGNTANRVIVGYNGSAAAPAITFGASGDTTLYRDPGDTAGSIRIGPQNLNVDGTIRSKRNTTGQISLSDNAGVPTIYFGNAFDTALYRSAANTLKTDNIFVAAGAVYLPGPVPTGSSGPMSVGAADSAGAGYRTLRVPN